ncbi:unnamed protein product [Mytilus coruscus]|uniref:Uncharacterized protein n=1 Tax=Mytilus coruscus TaxID=42192 RepID=A0A6J8BJX7_MYTCO|nr:unnamed protein product [Mytilus coruscus]
MLSDSKDAKVSGAKVKIRTGRKCKAEEAVKEADTRLRHSVTAVGRQGLGMTTKPRWDKADEKGKRLSTAGSSTDRRREQEYQGGRHEAARWVCKDCNSCNDTEDCLKCTHKGTSNTAESAESTRFSSTPLEQIREEIQDEEVQLEIQDEEVQLEIQDEEVQLETQHEEVQLETTSHE